MSTSLRRPWPRRREVDTTGRTVAREVVQGRRMQTTSLLHQLRLTVTHLHRWNATTRTTSAHLPCLCQIPTVRRSFARHSRTPDSAPPRPVLLQLQPPTLPPMPHNLSSTRRYRHTPSTQVEEVRRHSFARRSRTPDSALPRLQLQPPQPLHHNLSSTRRYRHTHSTQVEEARRHNCARRSRTPDLAPPRPQPQLPQPPQQRHHHHHHHRHQTPPSPPQTPMPLLLLLHFVHRHMYTWRQPQLPRFQAIIAIPAPQRMSLLGSAHT